jgi:hypothetical protein
MDVLKGLNIKSILKLLQKSDNEFLDLPKEMKFVYVTKTCSACNRQMKVTKNRENLIGSVLMDATLTNQEIDFLVGWRKLFFQWDFL